MSGHTQGPLTYFVGNANGRGLIRIEADHDSPEAGQHVASMPRGQSSEANAKRLVHCANCHEDLVAALADAYANLRADISGEKLAAFRAILTKARRF